MAHKPMYCSNNNDNECLFANGYIFVSLVFCINTKQTNCFQQIRLGFPFIQTYGFEQLFAQYGVDLEFWAHEHSYERLWPVYNLTVGSLLGFWYTK